MSTLDPVSRRQTLSPFGKAKDHNANKKCTTYGDIVYMELNPLLLLGDKGTNFINKYMQNIMREICKPDPIIRELIQLKLEITDNCNELVEELPAQCIPDWWGDENINEYIATQPIYIPGENNYNGCTDNKQRYQPAEIEELLPGLADKLKLVDNLVKWAKCRFDDDDNANQGIQYRNIETQYFKAVKKPQLHQQHQLQAAGYASHVSGKRPDKYKPPGSIKVIGICDPDKLSQGELRDFLDDICMLSTTYIDYALAFMKAERRSNEFFINFKTVQDLNMAWDTLKNLRVKYGYAIVTFERLDK